MRSKFMVFLCGVSVAMLFGFNYTQEKDKSLARAQKVNGKYVFLKCEPVEAYDVAFPIKGMVWGSSQLDSPDKYADVIVNKAFKDGRDFDGVIGGKEDFAIKFK